jgi:hypothetical protein
MSSENDCLVPNVDFIPLFPGDTGPVPLNESLLSRRLKENADIFFNTKNQGTQSDSSASFMTIIGELKSLKYAMLATVDSIGHAIGFFEENRSFKVSDASTMTIWTEHDATASAICTDNMTQTDCEDTTATVDRTLDDSGLGLATPSCSSGHYAGSPALTRRRCDGARGITGSGGLDPRVSGCSRRMVGELFVSSVSSSTSLAAMRSFLESKIHVLDLRVISHPAAWSKSFLLTVQPRCIGQLMSPDFWPNGIECRPFVRPAYGRLAK